MLRLPQSSGRRGVYLRFGPGMAYGLLQVISSPVLSQPKSRIAGAPPATPPYPIGTSRRTASCFAKTTIGLAMEKHANSAARSIPTGNVHLFENFINFPAGYHRSRHGGWGTQIPSGVLLLRFLWIIHRRRRLVCFGGTIQTLLVNPLNHELVQSDSVESVYVFGSGQCYKRQMQPLQKTAGFPFTKKPHSIRLVEVPAGQKGIKLSKDVMLSGSNQCFTISE